VPGPNQFLKVGMTLRFMMPLGQLEKQLENLVSDSSKRQSLNPTRQKDLRTMQSNLLVVGMLLNIVIALALARLFSNDIRKRLEFVAANTRLLAKEEDLPPPLGGKDEIAVLDSSFHSAAAELAAARKRERTLFDNSNDVICSFDETDRLTSVNPAASQMWGYTKDELLGSNFFDYFSSEDRESTKSRLIHECSTTMPLSFEACMITKNGAPSYVQWSAKRASGENEIFCMAHDISKRRESDRLRNEFLSMVSHDLRTPLSAILVTSTMLSEGAYGETPSLAAQKLSSVINDVNRLLELISDLLDIEKMEAGMMALTMERVELRSVLEDAAKNCSALLDEKNISLKIEVDEGLLEVDRDRFVQALSNLLSNSISRSTNGNQIEVLARKNDDSYRIIIRDQSSILDVDTRDNIFDRFAISSESERSGMSSLAVPLSKSIISAHGGTVKLMADEMMGNEFVIQLPLMQPAFLASV
ncbi:MAG: PAS domain-containing sensor histidine kinase, partial [Candidatus Obscuribacterales bacterium]|nr:PAS domain-containing sensor histidine kinase [Candidatus Obscuribacterales bacterium]